jgi:hypothetical protein
MGTIRCPKCDQKLTGKNEESLSIAFRNHLIKAHQMKLPSTPIGKGELAYGAAATITGPKVEDPWGGEVHGKSHLEERKKAGKLGPQENTELRCPICGALVIGIDEDEASGLVKTHVAEHGPF